LPCVRTQGPDPVDQVLEYRRAEQIRADAEAKDEAELALQPPRRLQLPAALDRAEAGFELEHDTVVNHADLLSI